MSMLCAVAIKLRHEGVSTTAKPPASAKVATLFRNTNWLHLLDPDHFAAAHTARGALCITVPARPFQTDKEQQSCVTTMLNCLINTRTDLTRKDLAAIEWCLGEVTGNVLTHSDSPTGGVVQLANYRNSQRVEVVIADAGLSIPRTLRAAHRHIRSDKEALSEAIKAGVTRSRAEGMGNGLFGTYQLATQTTKGYLNISSRYAQIGVNERGTILRQTSIPVPGTLVAAAIGVSQPGAIHQALQFDGDVYEPIDFLEIKHESDGRKVVDIDMSEVESLYSRQSAGTLRTRIENHLGMLTDHRIALHFVGIDIISSSFADECFGKLAERIRLKAMSERLIFEDANRTIREIINQSIALRMAQPSARPSRS